MESKQAVDSYRGHVRSGRGPVDRQLLYCNLRPMLQPEQSPVDRLLHFAIHLIEAYEQTAGNLEAVMRAILWALTHQGGRAAPEVILAVLKPRLDPICSRLRQASDALGSRLAELPNHPEIQQSLQPRLSELLSDAQAGTAGASQLLDAVMERHRRVQKQKGKGVWIEQETLHWTLMPGQGDSSEIPWEHQGAYLHPFRVMNAYSLLSDLVDISDIEVSDAEEA